MFERLPYRVMALHGGVIVGGDIYIQMTFNSAPLTSHDTMWERTIRLQAAILRDWIGNPARHNFAKRWHPYVTTAEQLGGPRELYVEIEL